MENRDWQKDKEAIEQYGKTDLRYMDTIFAEMLPYWMNKVKQLKEDNARWTCQWNGAEQKYQTQANEISEFKEREQKLRGGMEEVYELSKHDGESRYLDKCYVVARGILRSLYPLDKEETNEMDPM